MFREQVQHDSSYALFDRWFPSIGCISHFPKKMEATQYKNRCSMVNMEKASFDSL